MFCDKATLDPVVGEVLRVTQMSFEIPLTATLSRAATSQFCQKKPTTCNQVKVGKRRIRAGR